MIERVPPKHELQNDPQVIENSRAWGELRACAVFEASLQAPLRASTAKWSRDVAVAIRAVLEEEGLTFRLDVDAAGERLTALVEGLSERWLSGSLTLTRASKLLREGIARELMPVDREPGSQRDSVDGRARAGRTADAGLMRRVRSHRR